MKNKRYRAFSLVEMLVVLAITAALILLGFPPARQTWQSTQERIFWHRFDTEWDRTVQYMTANKSARLCFYRDEVVFMRGERNSWGHLPYPHCLRPRTHYEIKLTATGNVMPQSVYLDARQPGPGYRVAFQLGVGGRYAIYQT